MAKVSIIVPCYNVEKYLGECLNSLANQTFKDIEIICVNDCSPDNSYKILQDFAANDARIKIVNREKNGGLSAARNSGIDAASGEYIAFVDSDDWVDTNFIEKLYNAIVDTGSDIAAATILRTRKHSSKPRVKYTELKVFETLADKIVACNIPKCCYVWNKLYRANLVKENRFKEGAFYEDILWTPNVLKQAKKLICVPGVNYYYRSNSKSIVKSVQSPKKQSDSYIAKKNIANFFDENNLFLSKKERTFTKSVKYVFNVPFLKVKEFENIQTSYLFGVLPVFRKILKKPIIKDNTFIVWEPCSKSHSEVVPGYVKYLLDLGYHVSVLVTPDRYKEGLFSRFNNKNVSYNKLSQKEIKNYFKNNDISNIKGVLVTTVGKICDCKHYEQVYQAFYTNIDKSKLFFVEHEASFAVDNGTWNENLIMLRRLNYKGAKAVVVNPHYFGDINIAPKNVNITNFITIGAIRPNKKNSQMIVDAAYEIYKRGYRNFKVTVVGKGDLKHIPKELRPYFDVKGRLSFAKMYEEIEKADFMLTSYNEDDKEHIRYNTSGTSGNFQLVYGFLKPCIITEGFAEINNFNSENSILYKGENDYANALERAINMSPEKYYDIQRKLTMTAKNLYEESLENLKNLINASKKEKI